MTPTGSTTAGTSSSSGTLPTAPSGPAGSVPGDAPIVGSLLANFAGGGTEPVLLAVRGSAPDAWDRPRLHGAIMAFALQLEGAGVCPGDPVALVAAPGPEWVVA